MASYYLPYLFWLLAMLVLLPGSLRLSVAAFLLVSHIDMSGPRFDSAVSVGWENALKSMVLPAWLLLRSSLLLWREGQIPPGWVLQRLIRRPVAWLWIALVGYATLGSLQSPYPLAAAKLIAALVSHTILFLALVMAWLSGRLGPRTVWTTVMLIVALGVAQTYLVTSPYTNPISQYRRFTTFAGPQSFVEGFVPLIAILLWNPRLTEASKLATVALLLGVSFASGSRIGFLGALLGLGLWFLRWLDLQRVVLALVLLAVGSALLLSEPVRDKILSSRIAELKSVFEDQRSDVGLTGTFGFRQRLYSCYWRELWRKNSAEIILGSGTSSTGVAALSCRPSYDPVTFSANRVAHNEFLRATWEWGLIGLMIVIGLVTSMIWIGIRGFVLAGRHDASDWQLGPFVSALPLALLAFTFENILQSAGSPGPVGMTLAMALTAAVSLRRRFLGEASAPSPQAGGAFERPFLTATDRVSIHLRS